MSLLIRNSIEQTLLVTLMPEGFPMQTRTLRPGEQLPNDQYPDDVDALSLTDYTRSLARKGYVSFTPVLTAPEIVVQPVGDEYDDVTPVTLSVTAEGSPTLGYQWQSRMGFGSFVDILGATDSMYDATLEGDTDYQVVVTNFLGSATSSVAVVTVPWPEPPEPEALVSGDTLSSVVHSDAATEITLVDASAVQVNDILVVQTTSEQLRVVAVNGNVVTVWRARNGTVAAEIVVGVKLRVYRPSEGLIMRVASKIALRGGRIAMTSVQRPEPYRLAVQG